MHVKLYFRKCFTSNLKVLFQILYSDKIRAQHCNACKVGLKEKLPVLFMAETQISKFSD